MMKKKITIMTLTAIVSLGVALAIPKTAVEAQTSTPQISIVAKNLEFSDSIYLQYAVRTTDTIETDTLGMLVWTESQSSYEYGTQTEILTAMDCMTSNGVEYPVFKYTKFAAKQMTDVLYTRAYIERNGEYYYSAVKKYSVLEYVYNKLGYTEATPTEDTDFINLLNGMLDYGGLAQTYFGYKTDTLASDEFVYVRLDNATFSDGFNYVLAKAGTQIEVTPAEGYQLSETHAEYLSVNENNSVILTVPSEKTVDTASFVEVTAESETPETPIYEKAVLEKANLSYKLSGESYICTGLSETPSGYYEIEIPHTYNGYPVKKVSFTELENAQKLLRLTIGANVTSFNEDVFLNASNLVEVYNCSACTLEYLTANATSESNILRYGDLLIYEDGEEKLLVGYDGSDTQVVVDGVTHVRKNVFGEGIETVVLGSSVKEICSGTFNGITSLKKVVIGENVTTIQAKAFENLPVLQEVEFCVLDGWLAGTVAIESFDDVVVYLTETYQKSVWTRE